jgi:hypothetical protein
MVVSMAILALALGTLMAVFATGTRGASLKSDYQRALMLAESEMSRVTGPEALQSGIVETELDARFHSHIEVSELLVGGALNLALRPMQVAVTVAWSEGDKQRQVSLQTIRLRPEIAP